MPDEAEEGPEKSRRRGTKVFVEAAFADWGRSTASDSRVVAKGALTNR